MKRWIYGVLIAVVALAGYLFLRKHDRGIDQQISAPVLPPDSRAKVIVDNKRHTVTTVTETGITRKYLPPGTTSINVRKDGGITIQSRPWGTELSPFAGGALGSDFKLRVAGGVNVFFIQRWEVGGGLLVSPSNVKDSRLFVHVSYNVYSNWLLSLGADNQGTIHFITGLKF